VLQPTKAPSALPPSRLLVGTSTWNPPYSNPHISIFCKSVKEEFIHSLSTHKTRNNLNPKEIKTLKALKLNNAITIKRADKGGGITIMDTDCYIDKVFTMLQDKNTYLQVDDDLVQVKFQEAKQLTAEMHKRNFITDKQYTYLTNFTPKCPIFYGIPKIHKENWPLRPICSQIDSPSSKINELVDKLLSTAEGSIPYLLQDTTAFLNILQTHKLHNKSTLLVTMDVTALYTNIPHEEGTLWVTQFYEETLPLWKDADLKPIDPDLLKRLIIFILSNCIFNFNGTLYKQLYGTTMGAKFSVKFANIYMHCFLKKFVSLYQGPKPAFIARLIDDCFFFWDYSIEDLDAFTKFLNNCHPSIKFEIISSPHKVHFLDTEVSLINGEILTTVYTKPTDTKQYLHFSSCHPPHIFKSIPYSQAIRYKRIISNEDSLDLALQNLSTRFLQRGYPDEIIKDAFDRTKSLKRENLLKYRDNQQKITQKMNFLKGKSFLPLIIPYHQAFHNKHNIIKKHWQHLINSNLRNSLIFSGELPTVVFKRGTTLCNILCQSKCKTYLSDQDKDNIEILKDLELNLIPLHPLDRL
jgi:hypothetical protein